MRAFLVFVALIFAAGCTSTTAAEPVRLRVMSWNIHHAEGVDGKLDIQRIADVINAAKPDLVALQEIDRNTQRIKGIDLPAELARLTGLHPTFGKAIDYQGGDYGQLILSRHAPQADTVQVVKLPGDAAKEQRIAIVAVIPLNDAGPGAGVPGVTFVTTHFDHTRDSPDRPLQAAHLAKLLTTAPAPAPAPGAPGAPDDTPIILAGDLNALPDTPTLEHFSAARGWKDAAANAGPTIPAETPTRRIDYILLRPANGWHVIDAKVLDEPVASDHRPVVVTVELR